VSKERDGLVIVYTGEGKGKTTAALGIVVRALGRKLPVAVVQFVKGRRRTGEGLFAEGLAGLEFRTLGEGFTHRGPSPEVHAAAARAAWSEARELLSAGRHRVVVLDELTYVLNYGWVEVAELRAALTARPRPTTVVITGRSAPQALVEAADLVTEMRCVKHPYARGVAALPGVDL
jgi:cob(I)alamin adenosyltransferase